MRTNLAVVVLASLFSAASHAQLMDEKTHELTNRGAVVSIVAAAQVSEMRCSLKGQIAKALGMADRVNMHLDLSDKSDFSDVLFFATQILGSAGKTGWDKWCKNYRDKFFPLLEN